MSRVLLTGYSGFVGAHLLAKLAATHTVVCLGRNRPTNLDVEFYTYDLTKPDLKVDIADPIDCVVHCAAITPALNSRKSDENRNFHLINTEGTVNLAKKAVEWGAGRMIFLSSIKVFGEVSYGKPFSHLDAPRPADAYSLSKWEAERRLKVVADETGLELVIIRAPLVYGPGVGANFRSLLKLADSCLPLPFASISRNQRSLVSVKNLVDLIMCCITHPAAANETFLVSDDNDLSTAEIFRELRRVLNRSTRLFSFPLWPVHMACKILRKEAHLARLVGSLQIDVSHTRRVLNWSPIESVSEAFETLGRQRHDYSST